MVSYHEEQVHARIGRNTSSGGDHGERVVAKDGQTPVLVVAVGHPSCRGGFTADAIGWLKLGPMDAGGTGEGYHAKERMQDHTNTQGLPRFRALVRR